MLKIILTTALLITSASTQAQFGNIINQVLKIASQFHS